MSADDFRLDEAVSLLARTPASLTAMLSGLPESWLRATEGEGTWSPHDVIGHLVHAERTDWMTRARHIRARDARPFVPFDRTAQLRGADETLDERLDEFARLRREHLAELASWRLTASDLDLPGLHPELGPVTLGQLLATWVVHDLDHVAQIARTMAKRYGGAVGPWSAYLGILRDRVK